MSDAAGSRFRSHAAPGQTDAVMISEQIRCGGDRNFAFIIGDEQSRQAALVDPAFGLDGLLERLGNLGLEVTYIISTHGHSDRWPGHDYGIRPHSTIGAERTSNLFLIQPDFEAFHALKQNWLQYKKEHDIA